MSTMDEGKRQKRPRRSFTDDFKAGAVRLVLDEGKTIPQVARDLDLTESALRIWVERARADRTQGKTGLTGPVTRPVTARRLPLIERAASCRSRGADVQAWVASVHATAKGNSPPATPAPYLDDRAACRWPCSGTRPPPRGSFPSG